MIPLTKQRKKWEGGNMKKRFFRKHGSWFMFEKVPGAGADGAGGAGNDVKPGGDNTPPDPPASGDKPDDVIPKARFEEVIAERNDLRKQVETLGSNLSTVLERVNELSSQGKTDKQIAEIVSEEAKEWSNSKGFNEAVRAAVKSEIKNIDGKVDSTLQIQARIILDDFKAKNPDFDEKNPEVVKRIKAGYTLKDTFQLVYGDKKTLGKPGEDDDKKPPKPPGAPLNKPGPQDKNLKAPKRPMGLKEAFKTAAKKLGLDINGTFPKDE
jgi:hypothetical protein